MEKYFGWDLLVDYQYRYKTFPPYNMYLHNTVLHNKVLHNKVLHNKDKKPIDILVDETESNGLFYKYLDVQDDTYIIDSYR